LKKAYLLFVLVAALALVGATPLVADTFTFTYSDLGGATASGSLTGTPIGGGIFDITGGNNITFDIPGVGSGSGSLLPGSGTAYGFNFDNQLTPSANPQLDIDGLLFAFGADYVNIWGNGPGSYELAVSNGFSYPYDNNTGTFNATATPEPSSTLLLGTAFLLAAGLFRRHLVG